MKLSEKFSDRNLDDVFKLILLIMEELIKNLSKFKQDNLRNSMIVNLRKIRFLQQVKKIELIN